MQRSLFKGASACATLAVWLATGLSSSASDWPQWRGPNHDGRSTETGLLQTWPAGGPALVWKATKLGAGYATVSVTGGRIYTAGDNGSENYVHALKETDGNVVWSAKLGKAGAPGWGGFAGPRCTPTVDGDRVYALGQFGEFVCLNAKTGSELWRKHLAADFGGKLPEWGFSESPLVDGERVLVTPGGAKGAIVALNKLTGELVWQTGEFTDEAQYSSLVPVTIAEVPQYVQLTMASVAGVAASDGKLLWRAPRKGAVAVIPTPIIKQDQVYVTSGYGIGCTSFKVTKEGAGFTSRQLYANRVLENHHGGAILLGDHVYGHDESKGWTCQRFETGAAVWQEKTKLRKGSILYADNRFYLREESEESSHVALIEATPKAYVELGRFQPPDRSGKQAWPHPVIANGRLYLRDQDLLLCYDIKAK